MVIIKFLLIFYNSCFNLKYSFGRAAVIYRMTNEKIKYVFTNFIDRYNFDIKPSGQSSTMNETISGSYNWYSSGTGVDIYFRK